MSDMTIICLIACGVGIATVGLGAGMLAWDCWQWYKRHRKPRLKIKDAWKGEWH